MNNKSPVIIICLLSISLFYLNGCSVGALVNIKAQQISHPVSHTDNFYSKNGQLITNKQYEVLEPFSFTFTKWGVASVIDIEREEDISAELNKLVQKKNGDAIVNLTVSVSDPPINGLTFFTKVLSLWGSLIFIPLTIAEPTQENAIIAASSVLLYIFTPAAAEINVKGKVVKIL